MTRTHERERIARWAEELEGKEPGEILAAVAPAYEGRIALATSFGPEDNLLLDVIARERLGIGAFTLDTGFLFAQTYTLWVRLEERYGVRIAAFGSSAIGAVPSGPPPWEVDPDRCCEERKVKPLRAALGALGAWVTGIRREQTPERAGARVVEWDARFGLVKVNPLAGWSSARLWEELRRREVPTNPLHEQGFTSIGCAPCTTPVRPGEDPRSGRWRGRAKTECGLHLQGAGGRAPDPAPRGGEGGGGAGS